MLTNRISKKICTVRVHRHGVRIGNVLFQNNRSKWNRKKEIKRQSRRHEWDIFFSYRQSSSRMRKQFAGSISLALCLAMPAFLFLFSGILKACHRDRIETNIARAAVLTSRNALACYDRELYKTFGLFGLRQDDADKAISSIGLPSGVSQAVSLEEPLSEPQAVKDAVARHMSYRALLSILQDALDKIRSVKAWEGQLSGSWLAELEPDTLIAGYKTVDPDLPDYEEDPEWLGEYNTYMDDNIRASYQESLTFIAPVLAPDAEGISTPIEVRPFEKGGLSGVGAFLDRVFMVSPEGILDHVMLTEYSLCYLSSAVPFLIRNGVREYDKTPDGRVIADFSISRQYELEYVALGIHGSSAHRSIKLIISLMRFAAHLIYMATNPSIRAHYQTIGVTISSAVAAISLGTVIIPPEAISWVLMAAASIINGGKEAVQLCKGEEVPLWPGNSAHNIPMRYRDYVRLIIVIQSPDAIAKRLSNVIFQACPGIFYTAARTCMYWEEVSFEYVAGYLRRKEAEAAS
jgi:hypothetical protein